VQIEVTEYLLLLGAKSFVFQFSIQNIKIKVYRTTVFLLFCMGVKLGQNKKKYHPAPTANALSQPVIGL